MATRKRLGRSWGNKITMTNDLDKVKVHLLAWGDTGSGKTHLIGTAPKPFVIAPEHGLLTIFDKVIPSIDIEEDMMVYDAVMTILESAEKRETMKDEDGNVIVDFNEIETLALDSMWKLAEMIKDEIDETSTDSFKSWAMLGTRMRKIISKLHSCGYHTITTCGEAIKADKMDDSVMLPTLNLSGGFRDQAPYLFDINLYMRAITRGSTTKYKGYTKTENKRSAKSRVPLEREIDNPNFQNIIDAVQKGMHKELG
jgi:hypothetical protein